MQTLREKRTQFGGCEGTKIFKNKKEHVQKANTRPKLDILNTRQIKKLKEQIFVAWGVDFNFGNYAVLRNNEGKIFISSKDINKIELSKLKINTVGLYFAKQEPPGIRLSIEGSQMIGPAAVKNVLELKKEQVSEWSRGEQLSLKDTETVHGGSSFKGSSFADGSSSCFSGFVIIKYMNDFLGCGKITSDGKVLNFVPKGRRIRMIEAD